MPSTLVGNSVSFEAAAPTDDLSGHYACNFVNVRSDATPRMTLPPTDLGGDMAPPSDNWHPLLLLFIATVVSVLAQRVLRRGPRRAGADRGVHRR